MKDREQTGVSVIISQNTKFIDTAQYAIIRSDFK